MPLKAVQDSMVPVHKDRGSKLENQVDLTLSITAPWIIMDNHGRRSCWFKGLGAFYRFALFLIFFS